MNKRRHKQEHTQTDVDTQGLGFRVQVLGFMFQSLCFRAQVLGFRFQGLGFRVQILGFRAYTKGAHTNRSTHKQVLCLISTHKQVYTQAGRTHKQEHTHRFKQQEHTQIGAHTNRRRHMDIPSIHTIHKQQTGADTGANIHTYTIHTHLNIHTHTHTHLNIHTHIYTHTS